MACAPWNPLGCAADIAKSAAGDAFSSIAHDFGNTADSAVNWLWAQTSDATAVRLGGAGFSLDLGIVAAIAVTVATGLFVVQLIASTLRRDAGGLGRAVKGLLVAFIGAGIAIGATNLLLAAVDSLSAGVVQAATGQTLPQLGHAILTGSTVSAASSNPAAIIVFSVATMIAVAIVWAALTVRKVLIVISAVFAPLAFAGSLSDITASWVRRWIEVTVALIVSKLILVIIFVVGLDMLVKGVGQASSGHAQKATQVISGLLVLAVAGFAPWLALKLVHWSGDQFHQIHGLASASAAGAQKAVQAPQKAIPWVASGGAGGLAAAAAGRGPATGAGANAVATPRTTSGSSAPTGAMAPIPLGNGRQHQGEGDVMVTRQGHSQPTLPSVNGKESSGRTRPPGEAGPPASSAQTSSPASSTLTSTRTSDPAGDPADATKDPAKNPRPTTAPPWPTPAATKRDRSEM